MSDTKFVARCADCDHAYMVPNETKVYPCKKCGGEVCATVDEPEPEEEEELEEEFEEEEELEPTFPEERSIRARHTAKPKSKVPLIIGGVVALLLAVGGVGYGLGWFGFLTGAEPDFDKVTASFVEDWNTTDMEALKAYSHPAKLDEFSAKLDVIQANRGWTAFPTIHSETHKLLDPAADGSKTATIGIKYTDGDDKDEWAVISWQFFEQQKRWHIYDLNITPRRLQPIAEQFKEAWAAGDFEALTPFFKPGVEEKMVELYTKWATRYEWLDAFPALGVISITGEEKMRGPIVIMPDPVLVFFETPIGSLSGSWKYNKAADAWYNKGLKDIPGRDYIQPEQTEPEQVEPEQSELE